MRLRRALTAAALLALVGTVAWGCVVVPAPVAGPPPVYERPGSECRWVWMDGHWAEGRWIDGHWQCRRP